jgi:hypothetical protein
MTEKSGSGSDSKGEDMHISTSTAYAEKGYK